jgi:hypothetical protein
MPCRRAPKECGVLRHCQLRPGRRHHSRLLLSGAAKRMWGPSTLPAPTSSDLGARCARRGGRSTRSSAACATYEECSRTTESNPFAARAVRIYLREVRDSQAKARGIPYEKKKKKRKRAQQATEPSTSSSVAAAGSGRATAAAAAASAAQAGGSSAAPSST